MSDEFAAAAAGFPEPFRLLVRESAASTNDELRALAEDGAGEGLVLLALHQSAGRGRRGAAWFSEPGGSLAFSVLIRPQEPKALWPRLALATGLAVAEAVERSGPAAGVKWPNDVWIGRRKVAGILVEAGRDFVIAGIGINVNGTVFPDEIASIATSLRLETSLQTPRGEVLAEIIRGFARHCRNIGSGFDELLDGVRQRCVLTGRRVSLATCHGPRTGVVEGIAPGGELLLRTDAGVERLIQADEVRILG
ncbi:MAG: biotin--[acetyl-CoA-carboxylase] ligase [Akkermansiaceae bacterium]|jgi:BirA family biotin operon repressor/biotin-[acetyl-CoA-carboxylase] ligase|nr:biotin--[acetyl-CoA-carboxylase] ligase [Akkermansiaceae bacterium]